MEVTLRFQHLDKPLEFTALIAEVAGYSRQSITFGSVDDAIRQRHADKKHQEGLRDLPGTGAVLVES